MPFDIGKFLETGGKYAYEILSEQKKYKNKMDEIEAKIKAETAEDNRKAQAKMQETYIDAWARIMGSDTHTPGTKRAITRDWANQGLIPPLLGLGIAPTPTEIPTAGTTMPGELPSLRPEDVAGVGALFEPAAEEPKERAYGFTKEEYETKEKFKAKLKGPSVAERKLGMDAVSVAALIRQGLRVEKTVMGEQRFDLTDKQRAIDFAGEMGWTKDTPEYQQHIAPAIEEWWRRYQPQKIAELKGNNAVRKAVKRHLKKEPRLKGVKIDNEVIDIYIEAELEKVTNDWKKW